MHLIAQSINIAAIDHLVTEEAAADRERASADDVVGGACGLQRDTAADRESHQQRGEQGERW